MTLGDDSVTQAKEIGRVDLRMGNSKLYIIYFMCRLLKRWHERTCKFWIYNRDDLFEPGS